MPITRAGAAWLSEHGFVIHGFTTGSVSLSHEDAMAASSREATLFAVSDQESVDHMLFISTAAEAGLMIPMRAVTSTSGFRSPEQLTLRVRFRDQAGSNQTATICGPVNRLTALMAAIGCTV